MNIEDVLKGHGIGVGSGGLSIKSKQVIKTTFTAIETSKYVTISAIDLSKSILLISFQAVGNGAQNQCVSAYFTNNTTVRLIKNVYSTSYDIACTITIIELDGLKSLQSGIFTLDASTKDMTITNVNINKSLIIASWDCYNPNAYSDAYFVNYFFKNNTQITFEQQRAGASQMLTIRWFVIELK